MVCRVVSEVVQLSQLLTQPMMCACHGQPVQQTPANHLQQPATCTVSGHNLSATQLVQSTSLVQVSAHPPEAEMAVLSCQ